MVNINQIKEKVLIEYFKKFYLIDDNGNIITRNNHSNAESMEWLVEQIKDDTIKKYIKTYCLVEDDGSIVMKSNGSYLDSIISLISNDYAHLSQIRFFADHYINEIYSYRDFRKTQKSRVACCGFSESEQKWYGWTHRGIRRFGIGDTYFNHLSGKPAKTLEDCKKLAFFAVQELS